MRKWWLAIAAFVILFAGAYFGSPYAAARHFREAALSADADQLDAAVDFPAVRESLKSQLSVLVMRKLGGDPEVAANPFAGLGVVLAPAIINRAVDAYITPDGISAMVKGERPLDARGKGDRPKIRAVNQWAGIDRFRTRLINARTQAEGPTLVFERRGLFSWQLVKVELPADLFDAKPHSPT